MRGLVLCVVVVGPVGCFSEPAESTSTGSSSSETAGSTGVSVTTTDSTTDLDPTSSSEAIGSSEGSSSGSSGATDSSSSSSSSGEPVDLWAPEPLWVSAIDGGALSVGDRTDALWIDSETIWAVGAVARVDAGSQISLHTLSFAGELLETFVYSEEERTTNARTLTPSQSGIWIGGVINTDGGGTDRLLVEFDPSAGTFTRRDLWPETPGSDTIQTAQSNGAQLFLGGSVTTDPGGDPQRWTTRVLGDAVDWVHENGASGPGIDSIRASVRLQGPGNVVFAGARADKGLGTVPWVERLNVAGATQWETELVGGGWTDASAYAVTTNVSGDLFVAGAAAVPEQGLNTWVTRVGGNSGAASWTTEFDGGLDDIATGIASTADAVFICGSAGTDDAGRDAWVAKLDLGGEVLGAVTFDGGLLGDDRIQTCTIHESVLLVAGSYYRPGGADRDGFVAALPVDP